MKAMMKGSSNEANEFQIQPSDALAYLDAGATIACNGLHRWHEPVATWVRRLSDELGVPDSVGACNLYMSPANCGVPMHFDDHEVIIVQLVGSKTWRIAKNAIVENPTENSGKRLSSEILRYAKGRAPAHMPRGRTIKLEPGSALFLPRGYWHCTHAQQVSISLTFGFRVPSWAELVGQYLTSVMKGDVDCRAPAWELWNGQCQVDMHSAQWLKMRDKAMAGISDKKLTDIASWRNERDGLMTLGSLTNSNKK
jgi:50S ribosomal protein L16 3-hydroxylase